MLSTLFQERLKTAGQVVEDTEVNDTRVKKIFAAKVLSEAKYTYAPRKQYAPDQELDEGVEDANSEDEDGMALADPMIHNLYGSVIQEKDTVSTKHPRKRKREAQAAKAALKLAEEPAIKKRKVVSGANSIPLTGQRTPSAEPKEEITSVVEITKRDAKQLEEEKEKVSNHEKDKRTVFVSNFDPSTKKKQLKKFFSEVGEVESVRFRSGFTEWHWQWMRDKKIKESEQKKMEKELGQHVERQHANIERKKRGKPELSAEEFEELRMTKKKNQRNAMYEEVRNKNKVYDELLPDTPHKIAYIVFTASQPIAFPEKKQKGGRAAAKAAAIKFNGFLFRDTHLRVDLASNSSKKLPPNTTVFLGNLPYTATEEPIWQHFAECGEIETVRLLRDKYKGGLCRGIGFIKFKKSYSAHKALRLDSSYLFNRPIRVREITADPKAQFDQIKKIEKNRRKGKAPPRFTRHKKFSDSDTASYQGQVAVPGDKKFLRHNKPRLDATHQAMKEQKAAKKAGLRVAKKNAKKKKH
eukprot:TRINITY_DN16440_c0_g1_i1.p1 TRINITY_DN16440_c0_g1~~TRINITY_DN16440_c0_g1_i1.p1  ORF type:complete len:534 (+),score=273.03 TRINITY_DN16440_c0_g1_i1:32-1603(+)